MPPKDLQYKETFSLSFFFPENKLKTIFMSILAIATLPVTLVAIRPRFIRQGTLTPGAGHEENAPDCDENEDKEVQWCQRHATAGKYQLPVIWCCQYRRTRSDSRSSVCRLSARTVEQ
eukprot:GEMP01056494.1.p1 GENE.GEMP01056494.1~~GEMP01056494.1.p1  ORF type:complete len:118 (-),score=8.91 GEMP01056494.1:111-464(-)